MELPHNQGMIPSLLFSEDDYQFLMSRLWSLLAKQTEKYTMGDSTSVTVETAQELLTSLWYTITVALDEAHTPYEGLLTGDLWPVVKQGQALLRGKLEQTKRLWTSVCQTAPNIQNFYYIETLRGIGDYFKNYDLYFFANQRPACIDYPLLSNPSEILHGITYTEQYLKYMLTENLLLRQFKSDMIISLLRAVAPDYQKFYMNLCEQPLTNALGLVLIGKEGRSLRLGATEQQQIETVMQYKSHEKQQQLFRTAVLSLCREFQITDRPTREYLTSFADGLLPRLDAALDSGNVSLIFIDVC